MSRWMQMGIVMIACVMLLGGCEQKTAAPVAQGSDQKTVTPTTNEQGQAAQGSYVTVNQYNNQYNFSPRGLDPCEEGQPLVGVTGEDGSAVIPETASTGAGGEAKGVTARVAVAGNTVSGGGVQITTGNQTPGQTGTATGTTSGTSQAPTATATAYPTQHIQPEASISLPVGVAMPGGSVDQQATATGRGTSTGQTQTNTTDQRLAKLEATASKMEQILPLLQSMLGLPTTQPAGE